MINAAVLPKFVFTIGVLHEGILLWILIFQKYDWHYFANVHNGEHQT